MSVYDPKAVEAKWQKRWRETRSFEVQDSPDHKRYVLAMFPYPSGDGLHVGHAKIYTGADVLARYLRMRGHTVLHPMGWDAFGLPTENSAIKFGVHPRELTEQNIARFRAQMDRLGLSYDWSREINTTDPGYYKWTQWIFLQLFKRGLAYQATIPINWCPSCLTGLANEEVVDGRCERCGTPVTMKPLRQWMLRITEYADRLLKGLEVLDWPKFIIDLQRNWIGRSEGLEEEWQVEGMALTLKTFTTWPHTTWGATFMVIAPEHPVIPELVQGTKYEQGAAQFREEMVQKRAQDPTNIAKEKEGFFLGRYVINHLNGRRMPLYSANFAIYGYGTGIVKCTPAHDQRDFEFAKKYKLDIVPVIQPAGGKRLEGSTMTEAYAGEGTMINAQQFDGRPAEQARREIGDATVAALHGRWTVQYKLRDWVFSRQRYWGEPIPLIHCEKCGVVPVPEKDLPVTLPDIKEYKPTGTGESPLAGVKEWVNTRCPNCGGLAQRETNTMPQWAGSSWYWLRYTDPHNTERLADTRHLQEWLPVDVYVGGAEHAVLHLLYARFWSMVLSDAGAVPPGEPFTTLRNVGLVLGEGGVKMSKSRGNVINPDEVVTQYSADTLRVYEMFMSPFDGSGEWNVRSIAGVHRFLQRVWDIVQRGAREGSTSSLELNVQLQKTIQRVTSSIEQVKFNTGVAALMELLNAMEKESRLSKQFVETFVLLLSPYAPHAAEELWEGLGHTTSLAVEPWPQLDEAMLAGAAVTIPVQVNGRVRGTLKVDPGLTQEEVETHARAISNVAKYLNGRSVRKVIFVPDKLLNFVVS